MRDGRSRFAPPESIARDEPYCLFLDELNASSPEVQKAFYSLILDRRIGAYELPAGSIVIGAGNRSTDNALARPMASALVNRLVHIHLRASVDDWLAWAHERRHPRRGSRTTWSSGPDHMWVNPPKVEEVFSTPRSWHMLSDALHSYGEDIAEAHAEPCSPRARSAPAHASCFLRVREDRAPPLRARCRPPWRRRLADARRTDRDLLYFLASTFRARLVKDLPASKQHASPALRQFAHRSKALLVELAELSLECAQLVIADDGDGSPVLPSWFLVEVSRDLPRLVAARA